MHTFFRIVLVGFLVLSGFFAPLSASFEDISEDIPMEESSYFYEQSMLSLKNADSYLERLETHISRLSTAEEFGNFFEKISKIAGGEDDFSSGFENLISYAYYAALERYEQLYNFDEGIDENYNKILKLDDMPIASKPWSNEFKLSAPRSGFSLQYFNTRTQEKQTKQSLSELSISRQLEDPIGDIPMEDVGAYIIGTIDIPETSVYQFTTASSSSMLRILIDKKIVFSNDTSSYFQIELPKGKHTLEIEYINKDEYSLEMRTSYHVPLPSFSYEKIRSEISPQTQEVWYVGIYDAYESNGKVEVSIPKSSKSISLVLSSYEAVVWNIQNPNKTPIRDIVISSYPPGTTLTGVTESTKVYLLQDNYNDLGTEIFPMVFTYLPQCYDYGDGEYYCEGSENPIADINQTIQELYGKKLTGFYGNYSGSEKITLPGMILDEAGYKKVEAETLSILQEMEASKDTKDFNNMFDE